MTGKRNYTVGKPRRMDPSRHLAGIVEGIESGERYAIMAKSLSGYRLPDEPRKGVPESVAFYDHNLGVGFTLSTNGDPRKPVELCVYAPDMPDSEPGLISRAVSALEKELDLKVKPVKKRGAR